MIQTGLLIGVIPHLFFALIVPITMLYAIWAYSAGMRKRRHTFHTGKVIFACIIVVMMLGSAFATTGPPGPAPVTSDSIRFIRIGNGTFIATESSYLNPEVTLNGWGAGSLFSGGTGWITVEFKQNSTYIASSSLYVGVTSNSEPSAEGYDYVYLEPGTYDVEVVSMPDTCTLNIYQETIDGRNEAQKAWDEMELDYMLFIWIVAEFVILSEVYARKSFKPDKIEK
ncbi:MAG: hypothetical protein ACW975_03905 [Candidatus Thorarchaeota archaeon]